MQHLLVNLYLARRPPRPNPTPTLTPTPTCTSSCILVLYMRGGVVHRVSPFSQHHSSIFCSLSTLELGAIWKPVLCPALGLSSWPECSKRASKHCSLLPVLHIILLAVVAIPVSPTKYSHTMYSYARQPTTVSFYTCAAVASATYGFRVRVRVYVYV